MEVTLYILLIMLAGIPFVKKLNKAIDKAIQPRCEVYKGKNKIA